jgi:hypothetical protein
MSFGTLEFKRLALYRCLGDKLDNPSSGLTQRD